MKKMKLEQIVDYAKNTTANQRIYGHTDARVLCVEVAARRVTVHGGPRTDWQPCGGNYAIDAAFVREDRDNIQAGG